MNQTRRVSRALLALSALALGLTTGTSFADQVTLTKGDVLIGTVTEQSDDKVVLQHAVLGEVILPADQVAAVAIDGIEPAPAPVVVEEEVAKEWDSHVEVSASSATGNTDTQAVHLGLTSKRENEKTRTALDAHYFYGASDGDRTENRLTAGVLHDWLVPNSKWLYFASGRYDYVLRQRPLRLRRVPVLGTSPQRPWRRGL